MRSYLQCVRRIISVASKDPMTLNSFFLKSSLFSKNFIAQLNRSARHMAESLIITPKALEQLRKIIANGEFMRVMVDSGGCSGFEYKLSIDKTINTDDEVIEKNGVKVVVDKVVFIFIYFIEKQFYTSENVSYIGTNLN